MPRNPLHPKLPPKDPITGRRRRPRNKTKRKSATHSAKMKLKWQDPEYRAKMKERDRNRLANFDPAKYSRAGVPDGMTRAMAKPLWDRAEKLAEQFIQILKDTGQL